MHLPDERNIAPAPSTLTGFRRRMVSRFIRKQTKNMRVMKPMAGVVQIPDQATARMCYECKLPAMYFRFTKSKLGGLDKSSRQPVCSSHAGK